MEESAQAVEEVKEEQKADDQKAQVQGVEFSDAIDSPSTGEGSSLDILLDMQVQVKVSIGKTEIPVRKLLQMGPGSVLKLEKSIDEPVDLYLKDVKFATGRIVVVEDNFGIKIEDIEGLPEDQQPQKASQQNEKQEK